MSTAQKKTALGIWQEAPGTKWPEEKRIKFLQTQHFIHHFNVSWFVSPELFLCSF